MKPPFAIDIKGLKCDAPGCEYFSSDVIRGAAVTRTEPVWFYEPSVVTDAEHRCGEMADIAVRWNLAGATTQREYPGRGRYRVMARFITGRPGKYEYCAVSFWLPSDTGADSHTAWLAYREITNSRLHPTAFEGLELPSTHAAVDG